MMANGPMGFKRININQQAEVHHGGSSAVWVQVRKKQKQIKKQIIGMQYTKGITGLRHAQCERYSSTSKQLRLSVVTTGYISYCHTGNGYMWR